MVEHLGIVATQALQLWFTSDEQALGFPCPGGVLSADEAPFDTCASMSHLLPMERLGSR